MLRSDEVQLVADRIAEVLASNTIRRSRRPS